MMKKFWIVFGVKNEGVFVRYETKELAEESARFKAFDQKQDFVILEAIGVTKSPVPDIKIMELK